VPDSSIESKDSNSLRNASARDLEQVESARTNAHSGSAGGDQHASIEIVFEDGTRKGRDSKSAETVPIPGKQTETMLDQIVRARQGDAEALQVINQFRSAATSSPEIVKEIKQGAKPTVGLEAQLNTVDLVNIQKDADQPADQRMLAKNVQDMRSQAKLLGHPTDVIDDFARSRLLLKGGITEIALEKSLDPAEEEARLGAFKSATAKLLDGAVALGEDPVKIEALKIAPDDVGSGLGVYLLGADKAAEMGPTELKNFGDRFLIFGLAPIFGAIETGSDKWENSKAELGVQGSINFFIGTVIGAILEKANPTVFVGVTTAGIGAIGYLQLGTDEAKKRNAMIAQTYENTDQLSPREVLHSCESMRQTLGPEIFDGAFGLATGGAGLPEGSELRAASDLWLAKAAKLPGFKTLLEELTKIDSKIQQALGPIFNGGLRPAYEGISDHNLAMASPKNGRQDTPDWHEEIRSRPQIEKIEIGRLIEHPKVQELFRVVGRTGQIPKELGKEIADMIAIAVKNDCPSINKKNIGFAITRSENGEMSIRASVSSELDIAGTCPMRENPQLPIVQGRTVSPRSHSEIKLLEELLDCGFKGEAWIFTEQAPCDSCGPAIKFMNDNYPDIRVAKPTWTYKDQVQRQDANFMRGESLDD
jgi:hypothetical protein